MIPPKSALGREYATATIPWSGPTVRLVADILGRATNQADFFGNTAKIMRVKA